jgi:hypothetical protein
MRRMRTVRSRRMWWLTAVILGGVGPVARSHAEPEGVPAAGMAGAEPPAEIVIFGFEGSLEGWEIPDWARTSSDDVGLDCRVSDAHASEGESALELETDFPGGRWAGAYVEHMVEVTDWSPFGELSVDVYLPERAPEGLRGKIILTIGEEWTWTEMNRTVPLTPGAWTTIAVSLKRHSLDWRFFPDDEFRSQIRKIGVRIESDRKPAYQGSVFLDNIRLSEHVE